MKSVKTGTVRPDVDVSRLLGRVEGRRPGPTLVCVAGLHGNEPAGVLGVRRVLEPLRERKRHMRGRFVALAGNVAALRAGQRYLREDLNRVWKADRVSAARDGSGDPAEAETREQRELLDAIAAAVAGSGGPVYFLDLHTTSGTGGPFTTVSDALPNRAFAMSLPVPLVLGLEELVDGTLLTYLGDRGFVSAVFEAGQHEEPRAVDRAEAAIWITVAATGLFGESDIPELSGARKLLLADTRHLPRVLEMRHRHPVRPGDAFRMYPGYENFQRVRRGEVLARDETGPLRSPESARILMPLYQAQGTDGFFVVREFRPFWLHVSTGLRRLRLARLVHLLPGIRRHPERDDAVVVNRRIARWYALQLLHLLGFRKHLERGDEVVVVRRRFDPHPAPSVEPPTPGAEVRETGPGAERTTEDDRAAGEDGTTPLAEGPRPRGMSGGAAEEDAGPPEEIQPT